MSVLQKCPLRESRLYHFFFLMRDPPLNTSNNRSKHLYQSDHVVISISVFCLSNIDRRIVFVLIAVLFINFVLFSAFVHVAVGLILHELLLITRASGATFIGIFSSQKFWLSRDLLLFELRKWFPEKHYGIDAIHFLGHIRRSF